MESEVGVMLKEYDFSNARKNPYAKALKKQITINIDSNTIDYFKEQLRVDGILMSACDKIGRAHV